MAGKTNSRNWNDVQMVIIATSLVLTLTLWNLFAGPDRVKADKAQNAPVAQTTESSPVAILPNPTEPIKIMLGGAAPNRYVVVPQKQRQNGGGGGGGGGTVVGGGGGTVGGGGGTGGGGGGGGTGGS